MKHRTTIYLNEDQKHSIKALRERATQEGLIPYETSNSSFIGLLIRWGLSGLTEQLRSTAA
jgi:hypothetical protein